MVHSVRAHAWQQSTWRLPLWINHLQSYQNILCMQTQHWGIKMVCLQATTNQTFNISKPTGVLLIKFVLLGEDDILYWCWCLIESKCIDGWLFHCEGATKLLWRSVDEAKLFVTHNTAWSNKLCFFFFFFQFIMGVLSWHFHSRIPADKA